MTRFVRKVAELSQIRELKKNEWIEKLRLFGIKAAHPNDGWNNLEENSVKLCYPYFNDGVNTDDFIALGDYDTFVVVKVKSQNRSLLGTKTYFYYPYK